MVYLVLIGAWQMFIKVGDWAHLHVHTAESLPFPPFPPPPCSLGLLLHHLPVLWYLMAPQASLPYFAPAPHEEMPHPGLLSLALALCVLFSVSIRSPPRASSFLGSGERPRVQVPHLLDPHLLRGPG